MAIRRFRAARGTTLVAWALAGSACIKANPAFVDTDGDAASDTNGDPASDTNGDAASDTNGDAASDTNGETSAGCDQGDDAGSETRAIDLGTIAAGAPPGVTHGTLTPAAQSEWFTFATATSEGGPSRIVATLRTEGAAELCVFIECVDAPGVPSLLCDGGTAVSQSPLGRIGCCAANDVGLLEACSSDVNVFVQVSASGLDACLPFELEYRVTEPGG